MEDLLDILAGFVIAFAVVVIAIFVTSTTLHAHNEFNNWLAKCRTDGGQISLDRSGFFGDHYECYKDGRIINHVN